MTQIPEISTLAQQFLRKHIQSIWQLELLLYLRSAGNARNSEQISKALYIPADIIERALVNFEKAGIVTATDGQPRAYSYVPVDDEIHGSAEEAFKAYSLQRVQVMRVIYSASIQDFSDAFKLRGEEE